MIDATGKLVIPGGIDTHTHCQMPFMGMVRAVVVVEVVVAASAVVVVVVKVVQTGPPPAEMQVPQLTCY